jgi:GT2 family glycosyltransferase
MLRALFKTAQLLVLTLAGYNAVTALWGWRQPRKAPAGARARRFRVVIPAHNEAAVIEAVVTDLEHQDYPAERVRVVVLADRCTDETAALAQSRAEVVERTEGPEGKGRALGWYLELDPLEPAEALVVVDADNRLPPDILGRFADELDGGQRVLQAYLDVSNPDESALATAGALSYWAGNRMVQLARTNLGWSSDLGGTGMCFSTDALAASGGFGGSLTEDQEVGARLALAGERVTWLHDVRIYDEKPPGVAATIGQRSRWMSGKRAVAKRYAPQLIEAGFRRRDPALFDHALRLVQPGRSFVALVSGLSSVAAALAGGAWWLPWQVWGAAAAVQVLEPIPFLARDGVPKRYLVRYPLLVLLAALWAPIRVVSRRSAAWYHTPHGSEGSDDG